MNIIYLHTTVWPSTSPSTTFVTCYTNALASTGIRTELVVQKSDEISDIQDTIVEYFDLSQYDNWKISALSTKGKNNALKRKHYYSQVKSLVKNRLEAVPDCILITRSLSLLPLLIPFKKKYPSIKIIFESHDYYSGFNKSQKKSVQRLKNYFREKLFLPACDALICLQANQEQLYNAVYPNLKTFVLPSGCMNLQAAQSNDKLFSAVYIGSFDIHKGVGDLLKIWENWENSPPLILIGGRNRQDIEQLRSQIAKLNLSEKVELIEWKKPAVLPVFVAKAQIGLLPLQNTFFNRNLTFPLKLMDYISAGLPVVACKLPTIDAILTDGQDSILLTDFSAENVRKALTNLMGKPRLYHKLKENVSALQKEYSWLRRAEKTCDIISKLL